MVGNRSGRTDRFRIFQRDSNQRDGSKVAEDYNPLHHVFNLMSIMYKSEVFELCFQALQTSDPDLIGTALEYLENLLPPALRSALWPHMANGRQSIRSNRPVQDIANELIQAAPGLKTQMQTPDSVHNSESRNTKDYVPDTDN